MEYQKALEYAELFKERLAPACIRIEIVGSVKRADKQDVHDIEILLIPKDERPVPVFCTMRTCCAMRWIKRTARSTKSGQSAALDS